MKKPSSKTEIIKRAKELIVKKNLPDTTFKGVSVEPKEKRFSIKNIFKKKDDKKTLLINMELFSGFMTHFHAIIENGSFNYHDGTYILDLSMTYWDIEAKYYALDYHEGFCLPLKRHVDVGDLNNAILKSDSYDCETATNPSLIKQFLLSNIIEQVVAGARLSKWLQAMRIMMIASLVIGAITLLILFIKLGGIGIAK